MPQTSAFGRRRTTPPSRPSFTAAFPDAGSLARTRPGEVLEIVLFFFDAVRNRFEQLGLREGDVVLCEHGTAEEIVLRTARGEAVSVGAHYARFVLTRPLSAAEELRLH